MSGARPTIDGITDQIERAASQRDIDLDAVRVTGDGSDGRTFRVVETDAEDEIDQVGFQITYPEGPTADMTFKRRLEQYMDSLADHLRGDDGVDEADDRDKAKVAETPDEDPRTSDEDGPASEDVGTGNVPTNTRDPDHDVSGDLPRTTLVVSIDDESIATFRDEVSEAVDEATAELSDAEEVDERLDDLEARMDRLEELLGGLAAVSE